MRRYLFSFLFSFVAFAAHAQKDITQIKQMLDTTHNPVGFTKFVLQKKYTIDTVYIFSTSSFAGKADSLAYFGKQGKTYGPFYSKKEKYLVNILAKAPTTFYDISHILFDTTLFQPKFADSLANVIIAKIDSGKSSFSSMVVLYSADRSTSLKGGKLGWLA